MLSILDTFFDYRKALLIYLKRFRRRIIMV